MISLLLATAFAARPQIAVVVSDDLAPYTSPVKAFSDAVGVPVQTVNIMGRELQAEIELRALREVDPKVVYALGAKAAWAVRTQMPNTPMIYSAVLDPSRYGLTGNQVTGIRAIVPPVTYLSEVGAYFPAVRSVGVVRGASLSKADEEQLLAAGSEVGLKLTIYRVNATREFRKAFNTAAEANDAVWVSPDRGVLTPDGFRHAVEECRRRRKPLLADTVNMVAAGAAFAVTPSADGLGRQAAVMAQQIMDGASPAVIEVEDPQDLATALNRRTLQTGQIAYESLMMDFATTVID